MRGGFRDLEWKMFVFICSKEAAAEESFEFRYVLGNVEKEKKGYCFFGSKSILKVFLKARDLVWKFNVLLISFYSAIAAEIVQMRKWRREKK